MKMYCAYKIITHWWRYNNTIIAIIILKCHVEHIVHILCFVGTLEITWAQPNEGINICTTCTINSVNDMCVSNNLGFIKEYYLHEETKWSGDQENCENEYQIKDN